MNGKEIAQVLADALERAGLEESQRQKVMLCFSLAWGERLRQELYDAEFAGMVKWPDGEGDQGGQPGQDVPGEGPDEGV